MPVQLQAFTVYIIMLPSGKNLSHGGTAGDPALHACMCQGQL